MSNMLSKPLLAVGAALCALAAGAEAAELRLMTGPQGGVWVPLGGQLKDLWEKAVPGLTVQAMPGAGIANIRGIEEGKTEIGFGNTITTADAYAGSGQAPLDKPHKNVCNVATLYPQYFQVVVRADSGINSVKDLKGKSLTTQQKGNTGELITVHLLKAHGLSYGDMKVSFVGYTDSVTQMQDGHAHVFTLGTTIPSGAVMDLAAGRDIKLLDLSDSIEAMRKLNPGYALVTVPSGTYPKQTAPVKVIGYATHVAVSCKLPEDVVYAMTKTMAQNVASMAAVNKAITDLTPKDMAQDIGVPFHKGAAKFYKESGIDVQM